MASQTRPENVGILAMEIYFPNTYVTQSELEDFDRVPKGKYTNGLGQQSIAFTGDREDVNSIALTCVQSLLTKYAINVKEVGRLEVGTETLVDKSKSTKTVLMRLFASEETAEMEGVSTLNACYGGTAAFFNAVDWIESSAWDGRFALVVMPEIAVYDKGAARPTSGCGAIAILLGPNAPIVLDSTTRTTFSGDIYDFYKPDPSTEYPVVNGSTSQTAYLRALDLCYQRFASKQSESRVISDFRNVVFHSPYNKLVQKAFARVRSSPLIDPIELILSVALLFGLSTTSTHTNGSSTRSLERIAFEYNVRGSRVGFECPTSSTGMVCAYGGTELHNVSTDREYVHCFFVYQFGHFGRFVLAILEREFFRQDDSHVFVRLWLCRIHVSATNCFGS